MSDVSADTSSAKRKWDRRPNLSPAPLVYRLDQLENAVGLRRSAIDELIAAGDFPRPIRLGFRTKAWVVAEVEDWLKRRMAERDGAEARADV